MEIKVHKGQGKLQQTIEVGCIDWLNPRSVLFKKS
jgi:hypothetical protein